MQAGSASAAPRQKKTALYYWVDKCPAETECTKSAWKKAKCNGKTPEQAKAKLKHHLMRSNYHYMEEDDAEALAARTSLLSEQLTDDEALSEDIPPTQDVREPDTPAEPPLKKMRSLPDTPAEPPLKKMRSLDDWISLNDAVEHVAEAKKLTELATQAISNAEAVLRKVKANDISRSSRMS